jgi:hypothetical protein
VVTVVTEKGKTTMTTEIRPTVQAFLGHAVSDIDGLLGDGYAQAHPELISGYLGLVGRLNTANQISEAIGELPSAEPFAMSNIAEALSTGFNGIAEATQNVAAMLDLHSCGRSTASSGVKR